MIVITMTNCPKKLRGDMSKWLFEVSTGVYVGNLSAKVRDALWNRICDNVKDGQVKTVICYNKKFDIRFLQNEFIKNEIASPFGKVLDLLAAARRKIDDVQNYKLGTVAEYLGVGSKNYHRALADCETLYKIFLKLNEI